MTSSTIIDLWPICRRRDLSPGINEGVRRLKLSRYGPSDLALPDRSRIFSHGCREDIVLAIFVPTATPSAMVIRTLGYPMKSTKKFGSFSLAYWCWYSCRWWLTTSMVACVHVALILRSKNYGGILVSIFRSMVLYLSSAVSRKIQDYIIEEERAWRPQRFASFSVFIL
jgi:hypothetical protein